MRNKHRFSSVQQISGTIKALDRLEVRVRAYRETLRVYLYGSQDERSEVSKGFEDIRIKEGEVEIVESLIRRLALRITGAVPDPEEWEKLHQYCSRKEEGQGNWFAQNYEYFRWALYWIERTRSYLEFLNGCQSLTGTPQANTQTDHDVEYDVAMSFAGEDREHARRIAQLLTSSGYSVFYDEYEEATLWGRNLYTHLSDVYQDKARYCLMFISSHYARKLWTRHELEAAQARAFQDAKEYILPLRLDDTKIPGINIAIAYIDLRETSYEKVVQLLKRKMG